jgi:predicted transcriptional regulator of viral defense system
MSDDLTSALAVKLTLQGRAVFSKYEIARQFLALREDSSTDAQNFPTVAEFSKTLKGLTQMGFVRFPDFGNFWGIPSVVNNKRAVELACEIDPFCYMSHLSAMNYHGLTNRQPKLLFLTSPTISTWQELAGRKMRQDLGADYQRFTEAKFPCLVRPRYPIQKLCRTPVNLLVGKRAGIGSFINASTFRVAKIGVTFLEMLNRPELCGGMSHVVEVFEEHASTFSDLLIDEIDRNGTAIEKSRAGYILEERCGMTNDKIQGWLKFVQRGGSRLLDPSKAYESKFSKKWGLSLNVPLWSDEDE